MTAIVIFNVVFAAFVIVGIVSLLGRAIVADQRTTGRDLGLSRGTPAVRPRGGTTVRRGQRLNPAV